MRVLFFSNEFPGPHDPHRAVFNLRMCEAIARRHDVRVVAPMPWTDRLRKRSRPLADAAGPGIDSSYPTYFFVPRLLAHWRDRFMWLSVGRQLRAIAARFRPDVILTYWTFPDGAVALRLGRTLGVPVVQIVGGSDVLLTSPTDRKWPHVRRVLCSVDHVITIGRQLAERVCEIGVPAGRVTGLYRPVRRELFSPGDRAASRARLGLSQAVPLVLWVGRFVEVKGLGTLVDALEPLRRTCPRLLVCLLGEGPQLPAIQEAIAARRLHPVVRFVGPVANSELVHWYRAADVTVLPSLSEGIPNVLLESIACGTPFVASSVGGIPEIADPHLDTLVAPQSAGALAAALAAHLTRPTPDRPRAFMPATPEEFNLAIDRVLAGVVGVREEGAA